MTEEIVKIKAEIFDIICQQEEYIAAANTLQQTRTQRVQQLKDKEQSLKVSQDPEKKPLEDEIIKIKAEIYDIISKQDEYMAAANTLQQTKAQKLQQLAGMQKDIPTPKIQ